MIDSLDSFHPAVAAWFRGTFSEATPVQGQAWPAIRAGRDTLIAAPTGSGKTFAAFLAVLDSLLREGLERGLPDETRVVYISPLKALSNDIQKNLAAPLHGIREALPGLALPDVEIRTLVRTGDTPPHERASMRRRPPHIVVTTPESLYILLGSESGRRMLATTQTVIVDEIHAVAATKRGAHLALSLERLQALAAAPLTRIGLSATQTPIEEVARFLTGGGANGGVDASTGAGADAGVDRSERRCTIIDAGHRRRRDLALELPPAPLEAVMSGEVWSQLYDRLAELVREHRSTLVFVNTRRLAERAARQLSERLGAEHVMAHHGSLARERRLEAEQRLKRGELKALVATASLELGIDIGDVDLVCQIGSPRSINAFLQRVGRSGHAVGGLSKGRLFPLSRDELIECAALLDAVGRGELDQLHIPRGALDVLAQQIAAEVSAREWNEDELHRIVRAAYPYRDLERGAFDEIARMLADGFATRRGRRGALVHRDAVRRQLRPRRGARLTAITSGGAIPDTADYQVILEPAAQLVGTVHEDFAVESLAGDVFQLGNTSYRILRVERGTVRVADAEGTPPTIPFWLGEAPGRSDELSAAVSRLRREIEVRLSESASGEPLTGEQLAGGRERALAWLAEVGIGEPAAAQIVDYLAAARGALGVLPTQETVILERFFDEAGGMQLVVHSPFGSRVNRAWGLALRKRFCRRFNFELQAAATEDSLVLSLTSAHSFELAEVARYLSSHTARHVLVQAVCAAPMFATRWRWVASISLALPRFAGGRRVPPPLARMRAEDLLAAVFPDQVACAENLTGELEIPDHPLVRQTLADCLEEAMDVERFEALLRAIESGTVRVLARDLTEPSPLALEVLSARPYAYLDDAPLEERRTQAVMSRRWLDPRSADEIGRLDQEAIERVRAEAWPEASTADELQDALQWLGFLTAEEIAAEPQWAPLLTELAAQQRIGRVSIAASPSGAGAQPPIELTFAAERRELLAAVHPAAAFTPVEPVLAPGRECSREEALRELVRGRLQGLGPATSTRLATSLGLDRSEIDAALLALQSEGFAMRGRFTPGASEDEWCERGLLARIHRYTVKRLRAEVSPVSTRDFLRFLAEWQRLAPEARMQGPDAVAHVLSLLEGFEAPAGAWEAELLPARVAEYEPAWLDAECLAGRFVWVRLASRASPARYGPLRSTPITFVARRNLRLWAALADPPNPEHLTGRARAVSDYLETHGASFFDDLLDGTRLLPAELEEALGELVAMGLVQSDSFAGLRALLLPSDRRGGRRGRATGRGARGRALYGMAESGRWTFVRRTVPADRSEAVEHLVRTLLKRWGVLLWRLLAREAAWLAPWREILACCRRLEARGDIRGGRFVEGLAGEQFAAPEAIGLLREVRRAPASNRQLSISAADPLNLLGILTPGARLPALTGNRMLYREGLPLAMLAGGEVTLLESRGAAEEWDIRNAVLRRGATPAPTDISGS
jgi:ATP-dependent helicase Lhr and Lhr-like helicase